MTTLAVPSTHPLGPDAGVRGAHALASDVAHVWIACLDAAPPDAHEWLSEDDRARAARMPEPRVRSRFVAARTVMRSLLVRHAGVAPHALRLRKLPSGKPVLDADAGAAELHFNIAHADDLLLVAIARHPVGVDVELLRELPELDRLARAVLAPGERAALLAHPREDRSHALLRAWTRKEAYFKATGEGVRARPARAEVTLDPRRAALIRVDGEPDAMRRWRIHDVDAGADAVAALAVPPACQRIVVERWCA